MFSQLGHLPRFIRLTLLITLLIVIPTLYFLYPTPERLPSPGEYQAGGIDSEHWRKPVNPDYSNVHEEVREWDDELPLGNSNNKAWKGLSEDTINGGVIMPKLGNETAKAELGRSAWRVLHLMTLRYPDEPTEDDRQALKSYFHLFSRLYPCGECAAEFQKLLKEYPPQTGSRKSASLWLCHVHNLVNERLGKPEFDCLTLDETYDCGCGDESSTGTTPNQAENTGSEDVEEEGERGLKDTEQEGELVMGHGGGEIHLKRPSNEKEEEKGKQTEKNPKQNLVDIDEGERPIDKIPHKPVRPAFQDRDEEEEEDSNRGKGIKWKEVTQSDDNEMNNQWENVKFNEEKLLDENNEYRGDLNRHDGSRIKVVDENEDELRWDE
ncbi:hypothetical protein I203_102936 [Kwoniella mangroviensis CBS 8507]|uniref:uncharacterized protein n=1 Tax=Kwoniella mangroviensis CBS 8507 TaxID=1296122 RepID=UPI00080CF8A5|nr:uncharacterized protein I203_03914 [Kwoniella mangroviensis CBS 8507]OCF67227.1 hypothetical protein I203_03914 [Kwoniella mangroviensis CBS 8507]